MRKRLGLLGLGLIGLVLVACSQQPVSQHPPPQQPPPQANATPQETSQNLLALGEEIQQAIRELQEALQELLPQPLSTQALNLDTLQALPDLRLERLFSIRPQDVVPLETQSLLRGKFEWTGGDPRMVGPSDDLEVLFRQKADDPWNKLLADWDASTRGPASRTVETHPPYNKDQLSETPTKAFFAVDFRNDGKNEGEATFNATWRSSTCVPGKYLIEPESLGLKGFLDHPTTGQRLVDLANLSLTTSPTRLGLEWDLSLLVEGNDSGLKTQGRVVVNGSAMQGTCGSLLEKFKPSSGQVSLDLSTRNKSLRLEFGVTRVEENPTRIHIQNGLLRGDSKVVTFEGILDDQNNNCVPGENLTLRFAAGETMSLEAFLIQHMDAKPCNRP